MTTLTNWTNSFPSMRFPLTGTFAYLLFYIFDRSFSLYFNRSVQQQHIDELLPCNAAAITGSISIEVVVIGMSPHFEGRKCDQRSAVVTAAPSLLAADSPSGLRSRLKKHYRNDHPSKIKTVAKNPLFSHPTLTNVHYNQNVCFNFHAFSINKMMITEMMTTMICMTFVEDVILLTNLSDGK